MRGCLVADRTVEVRGAVKVGVVKVRGALHPLPRVVHGLTITTYIFGGEKKVGWFPEKKWDGSPDTNCQLMPFPSPAGVI